MLKNISQITFLNFFSGIFLTISLQLILLPSYSENLGETGFGNVVFSLGVVNLLCAVFAASLSNYRLRLGKILGDDKKEEFLLLFIVALFTSIPIVIFISILNDIDPFFLSLYLGFLMFRTFGVSFLRLDLDYISITKLSILISVLILIIVYFFQQDLNRANWTVVLIIPEFIAALYLNKKIKIITISSLQFVLENLFKKKIFRIHLNGYLFLIFLQLAESSFTYLDRFVLQYFLGSEDVAKFYVLTSMSKFQPLIFNMLSGVILSYLAFSKENLWSRFKFKILTVLTIISLISVAVVNLLDEYFIDYFYPKLNLDGFSEFLLIASFAYCLVGIDKILRSFLIKYVDFRILVLKEIFIILIIFISIFLLFINNKELLSFLIILLIASIFRVVISLFFLFRKDV